MIKKIMLFVIAGFLCCFLISKSCYATVTTEPAEQSLIASEVRLALDGQEITFNTPPFINLNNRTMISLSSAVELFACETVVTEANEITLIKNNVNITMLLDDTNYRVNNVARQCDSYPVKYVNQDLLVPLRVLAQEFSYQISYNADYNMIIMQSPGFTGNPLPETAMPLPPPPEPVPATPPGDWGLLTEAPQLMPLESNQTLIAGYYTRLINSPAGRTNNIILSCRQINGKILNPGEVFSFNQAVGPRTEQTGYQMAAIFAGKKVVQGIGGGICQTVSTLYNVVLEANLPVVERHPHSLKVAYVAPERDATVSWGIADFKFKNTSDFPLTILCKVEGDYVVAALVK